MADAFENILGQPQVRDLLRSSVRSERVTHAYLFCGPAGSNKTQAAFSLAQVYLCQNSEKTMKGSFCGACETCARIKRRTHPDVRFFEPEGANGYLVEQIRDIVSDVELAPIQANAKVYILDRVDLMNAAAANAFLKTLEEPPDNVMFILLGRTRDSVLPTIASRCQIVPFRHIPPNEAAGIVAQNTGLSIERARQAIAACDGSITSAIRFLRTKDKSREEFRISLLARLSNIRRMSDWDLLLLAKSLVEESKAPLDELKRQQESDMEKDSYFLAKAQIQQIEARNKRRLSKQSREYMLQTLSIMMSWARDVMVSCSGTPELIINEDYAPQIEAISQYSSIERLSFALQQLGQAQRSLDYNVSPETCLDFSLFELRKAFDV